MQKFMQKLARFFYGRYGMDSLYTALLVLSFVLIFVNAVFGQWWLHLITLAVIFWTLFRSFSKNIPARRKENKIWLKIWRKITFGKGPVRQYPNAGGYGYGNYGTNNYGGYGNGYGNAYGGYNTYTPPKKKKLKTDKDHCFRICPECRANIRLPKKKGKHTVVCPRCKCRFEVKI